MNYKGQAEITWLSILMSGENAEIASLVTDIVWEQAGAEPTPMVGGPGGLLRRSAKVAICNYPSGVGGATHFRVALNEEVYQGETGNYNAGKNDEGVKWIQYITSMKKIK